ncbi:MAG: 2-C-methyl-D-erythritol 2,4-cyclodiphosphate synthase [Clostridia bacterium]|nr:2-C-methyl-D-erythritol 2,4-cyclodiphosphate synthase [Clostridia bacterium]
MRIGHGYDAHRYAEGRPFVLGGVKIDSPFGMAAHSDGDVLAHAIIDALLGAAGLPDIGSQFPDTDEKYRDISSMILLSETADMVRRAGFRAEYIDCTVIAQEPKLSAYLDEIKKSIAENTGLKLRQINVKATTEERMGFTGALEGICAHAVCLLDEHSRSSSM